MEAYNDEVKNLETHSIEVYMEEADDALHLKRIKKDFKDVIEETTDELYGFIKKFIPKHLMSEYHMFTMITSCGLVNNVIEQCIEKDILNLPQQTPCAEGTWMMVSE